MGGERIEASSVDVNGGAWSRGRTDGRVMAVEYETEEEESREPPL